MAGRTRRRGVGRLGAFVALLAVLVAVAGTAAQATSQQNRARHVQYACRQRLARGHALLDPRRGTRQREGLEGDRGAPADGYRRADRRHPQPDLRGSERAHHQPVERGGAEADRAQARARSRWCLRRPVRLGSGAYNATNDQVLYGRLGAEWLFKKLGGSGNVVEMRGIAGVPADTDRHKGFQQALKKYPNIKVAKSVFTGWSYATGGKQMLDILNSGVKVDGVWTSGIDYTVVNAFKTAGKPYVPIVGADNAGYVRQLRARSCRARRSRTRRRSAASARPWRSGCSRNSRPRSGSS